MGVIKESQISSYNRALYAYVVMLKQFSARHSDVTLITASVDIENIYNGLSSTVEINVDNIDEINKALGVLRLCVLNLQITTHNRGYKDIEPICEAISTFVSSIHEDIQELTEESKLRI